MNEKDFLNWCKKVVAEYTNKHLDKSDKKEITADDVFMVWCYKTLQNNKALLSTILFDGMYYECTYNGDKKEMYVDAYKKWENYTVRSEKERENTDNIFANPPRQHYEERRDEYGKIYILNVETGKRIYNNGGGFGLPPNSVLRYLDGTNYYS